MACTTPMSPHLIAIAWSYMRAWKLLQTMNASFRAPVAIATRGGAARGRVELTETGKRVLALYQEMDAACRQAADPAWRELADLLACIEARTAPKYLTGYIGIGRVRPTFC